MTNQNQYPLRLSKGWVSCTIYRVVNNHDWISYVVTIRVGGGNRERTTFSDEKEAREFANHRIEELKKTEPAPGFREHKFAYYQRCERKLDGIALHEAVDLLVQLMGAIGLDTLKAITREKNPERLRALCNELLAARV